MMWRFIMRRKLLGLFSALLLFALIAIINHLVYLQQQQQQQQQPRTLENKSHRVRRPPPGEREVDKEFAKVGISSLQY